MNQHSISNQCTTVPTVSTTSMPTPEQNDTVASRTSSTSDDDDSEEEVAIFTLNTNSSLYDEWTDLCGLSRLNEYSADEIELEDVLDLCGTIISSTRKIDVSADTIYYNSDRLCISFKGQLLVSIDTSDSDVISYFNISKIDMNRNIRITIYGYYMDRIRS